MKQIFTHTAVSAFHRQQNRSWQDEKKLWQTTVNKGYIWNSKQGFLKILQSFRKSGNWQSGCVIPRKGDIQTIYYQETQAFCIKIYKLCDSTGYTWHESVLGEGLTTHDTPFNSNSCHNNRTDQEDRRMWSQIVHGQFLFLLCMFWWLDKEKINCRATVRLNRKGKP